MVEILKIANLFDVQSEIVEAERYGCGHINDTYRITDANGKYYILQKINNKVFKDVDGLMSNIVGVTEYIKEKMRLVGEPTDNALSVIPAKDGKKYWGSD